ncbi:helix-turn-helix transcriptional regulator [Ktedonosporobacter rubrisoli]|nr:helix-turn-helix transcriptional regulator [Ktedonosporobacter rubrisoli]
MQQKSEKQRREELGEFLRTRRARLSSEQIGMPKAPRRRTPGLRREEVAIAAGVSTTWYTYLEQGRDIQVSSSILASLANVLQLSAAEREHLFTLANLPPPARVTRLEEHMLPLYQRVLDELGNIPALLTGYTYDLLAWNRAASYVFGDLAALPEDKRNMLWLLYVQNPFSQRITVFSEREQYAQEVLEAFRGRANRHLDDPELLAFIENLKQASPRFSEQWAQHNVRTTCTGHKTLDHPRAGRMHFESLTFQVIEYPDIRCHMYVTADEPSKHKLHQLLELDNASLNMPAQSKPSRRLAI